MNLKATDIRNREHNKN